VIEILIKYGFDFNVSIRDFYTPLMWACY